MMDEIPSIMTMEQVAKHLRLHMGTIRQLAREGEMPAFKVDRQWRVKKALLARWIEERSAMDSKSASEL